MQGLIIVMIPKPFSFEDQASEFIYRGINFKKFHNVPQEMQRIGYYKLKEFTYTYSNWHKYWYKYSQKINEFRRMVKKCSNYSQQKQLHKKKLVLCKENKRLQHKFYLIYFHNLNFSEIEKRYRYDKLLRINVLNLLESIEVSFDSNLADILGEKYGPFGYLHFVNWSSSHISYFNLLKEQNFLKTSIIRTLRHSLLLKDLYLDKNFKSDIYFNNYKHVYEYHQFPTVWLMADIIDFGITTHLISYMDLADKLTMSHRYNCHFVYIKHWTEWIQNLNSIRNICAHNGDLLDFRAITPPRVPKIFKRCICNKYHTAIASTLFIIKYLMLSIDPLCKIYNFMHIYKILYNVAKYSQYDSEIVIHKLGFRNMTSLKYLIKNKDDIDKIYHSMSNIM